MRPIDAPAGDSRDIYSVSRLNREVRVLLERGLPALWLEGEMSNLARPSSGHWYFSLKDAGAQLRCAMFRQRNAISRFSPRDGQKVLVRGRVGLYEPRGEYQMIVDFIEDAGVGALQREFDRLKAKLAAEGLFDPERKLPLPPLPRRIGVITSPTGAAVRDILHVLERRFAAIPVLIYPVPVQGATAAAEIVAALQYAQQRQECDVLILARGGGSIEDLWAFNDEALARAIAASSIPLVTGIGHEIDFTIADFAASARAPTPSAAAELVVPNAADLLRASSVATARLAKSMRRRLADHHQRLRWLEGRAARVSPMTRLHQRAQALDEFEQRLARALSLRFAVKRNEFIEARARLWQASPAARLRIQWARHDATAARLRAAGLKSLQQAQRRWLPLARTLHAVSPLATLERGYAIVSTESGAIARDASTVKIGSIISARLARGTLRAKVESQG